MSKNYTVVHLSILDLETLEKIDRFRDEPKVAITLKNVIVYTTPEVLIELARLAEKEINRV